MWFGSIKSGVLKIFRLPFSVLSHLSVTVAASCLILLLMQFEWNGLKGILVDSLFRLRGISDKNPDIVLIEHDPTRIARHLDHAAVPVAHLIKTFEALKDQPPKAVAVIAALHSKNYTEGELSLLAQSFSQVPLVMVGYLGDEMLGMPAPSAFLNSTKYLPGFVSRDTYSYGADSVSRRVMISIEGYPTVYSELAKALRKMPKDAEFANEEIHESSRQTKQTYINWQGPTGTYPVYSMTDVIEKRVPPGTFKNKIVLIGRGGDPLRNKGYILTPFTRTNNQATLLEGAAHSLETLISNRGLQKSSPLINIFLSLLIGLLTVNLALLLSPGQGILVVLALIASLGSLGAILLFKFQYWLDLSHPLVTVCLGYYLVVPFRLYAEYRRRWHYQEKSEFMTQLEQIKSNFLSLISHDLKTPVARIQGNAEILLNEGDSLNPKQKKMISGIIQTTEDLSHYVETILDLTRVENAQIPVQLSSKDINAIIQDVIESKQPLALEKQITLIAQLEPLFSFKFDPRLIRRVLDNLVENAIKYSPENRTIRLVSKEENKWVKVSVIDEGLGISAAEQNKVFNKFYRVKDPNTKDIKGTGLGLYLVKYFVELHKGFIELHSELGKGSRFTISLPV